ncbi:hypothetical protein [Clostridium sp. CF012]|uniref:hypothetical protein n=1 Tax=Clostridium sp. CF012 TaxID=2843319 RepID=UPI002815FE45|nr:hypothetical protein [Clostridium sp. CF012]
MKDFYSDKFIEALKKHDIHKLRTIPKSDLHNHFVLGGSRDYIQLQTGIEIPFLKGILASMKDMNDWNNMYIGERFNTKEMRKLLIDATFVQAKEDGIKILEIGEDVWGLGEFFDNSIEELIRVFQEANQRIAPEVEIAVTNRIIKTL